MSGHSKWATIKHKKGALDAKRGNLWSKVSREITIAAKMGGGNPDENPRLRLALAKAKQANMPKDNIDRGIKKGTGELEGVSFEDIAYEGYAPGGVSLMIDVTSDNKNRTAAEIRSILTKHGGNMAEKGAVAWGFDKKALFTIDATKYNEDDVMAVVLDAGAEDLVKEGEVYSVTGPVEIFADLLDALKAKNIETISADVTRIPKNTTKVTGNDVSKVLKLIDMLEAHDDVQTVSANFDISDEDLAKVQE
ncbi:MAG: YebC/PmpR family DNA-binding transcriptional regulator [Spirochaetes bacterium]|nr:YebC/PmpR family DNA-binding transcriptional regulator [Spirochaetota bacterium]